MTTCTGVGEEAVVVVVVVVTLSTGFRPVAKGFDAGEEVNAEGYCFPPEGGVEDAHMGEPMRATEG